MDYKVYAYGQILHIFAYTYLDGYMHIRVIIKKLKLEKTLTVTAPELQYTSQVHLL